MRLVVIPFGFFADDLSSHSLADFSAPLIADRVDILTDEFEHVTLVAGWQDGESTVRRPGGNKYVTVRTTSRRSIGKYLLKASREILRNRDRDVVVVNFNPHLPGCVLATLCRLLDIPFVTYFIGLPAQSPGRWGKHVHTHRYLLNRSTISICTTPVFRDRLQEIADVPLEVVPNGVHDMFHPDESVEQDDELILYVGRFAPEKRLPLLVRAFAEVRNRSMKGRLALIGARRDDKRAELASLADELGIGPQVTVKGRIPREEVPEWMNRARTFVLPSRDEAFGMVLIEAMACGTPPIGMNSGSVPWVIDDAGAICEDKPALADAIERMLTDDDYYTACRERSLHRAQMFSREQWRENIREAILKAAPNEYSTESHSSTSS